MRFIRRLIKKFQDRNLIKLFYSTYKNNFGDILSFKIVEHLTDKKIICCQDPKEATLVSIGSLLDLFLKNKDEKFFNRKIINIWGSGFIAEEKFYDEKEEALIRNVNIFALRGKLSQKRMENILNKDLSNITLGDPGLLANSLLDLQQIKKSYKLGVILHYVDQESDLLNNILIQDYLLINITDEPKLVLENIAKCEFILSSAMHGLIASDSMLIPNRRVIFSDKIVGGDYKFDDYYSAFDLKQPHAIDLRKEKIDESLLEQLKNEYSIKKDKLNEICNNLIISFQKIKL